MKKVIIVLIIMTLFSGCRAKEEQIEWLNLYSIPMVLSLIKEFGMTIFLFE